MPAFLAALLLAATPGPLPEEARWGQFSRLSIYDGNVVVRVGTLPGTPDEQLDYWFERHVRVPRGRNGHRVAVSWADTRHCPGARAQLLRLRELEPPRFTPPGTEEEIIVPAGGVAYSVEGPLGVVTETMRIDTITNRRVKAWVDAMLATLEPCWTQARPDLNRRRRAPLTSH